MNNVLSLILKSTVTKYKIKKKKIKYHFNFRPAKYQRLKNKKTSIDIYDFITICKLFAFEKGYVLWSSIDAINIEDRTGFFVKRINGNSEINMMLDAVKYLIEEENCR